MDRGRLLRLLPPAVGLMMGALSVTAAPAPRRTPVMPRPEPVPAAGTFVGVSSRGSIQEALDDALGRAARAAPGETVLRYRISEIRGERAGGDGIVRVSIQTGFDGLPRISRN